MIAFQNRLLGRHYQRQRKLFSGNYLNHPTRLGTAEGSATCEEAQPVGNPHACKLLANQLSSGLGRLTAFAPVADTGV
jgi:hypothetical protein